MARKSRAHLTTATRYCLAAALAVLLVLAGCASPKGGKSGAKPPPDDTSAFPEFPWPPPVPSTFYKVPRDLLFPGPGDPTFGLVAQHIESALGSVGYSPVAYFSVPEGFAMATRLEQTFEDGEPREEAVRWLSEISALKEFSLSRYLEALFTADVGYYRVIVFVVTPQPFAMTGEALDETEATNLFTEGAPFLPANWAELPYSSATQCIALIYEFERTGRDEEALQKVPGRLSGEAHLEKAKIIPALGE